MGAARVGYRLLVAGERAGMRVVVVSTVEPLAAPYEADVDSVSGFLAASASDAPAPEAVTSAVSQFEELARLSPQIRAVVQVKNTHGSAISTPVR